MDEKGQLSVADLFTTLSLIIVGCIVVLIINMFFDVMFPMLENMAYFNFFQLLLQLSPVLIGVYILISPILSSQTRSQGYYPK